MSQHGVEFLVRLDQPLRFRRSKRAPGLRAMVQRADGIGDAIHPLANVVTGGFHFALLPTMAPFDALDASIICAKIGAPL